MAMDLGGARGGKKRPAPDMNVTPLIDVVLVLLIIFMAMTPVAARKFWVHTPKQEKEEVDQPAADPQPPLVLSIAADGVITVNGVTLTRAELPDRLRRMFAARTDHVLFFDAADDVPFAVRHADDGRGPRRRRGHHRHPHPATRRSGRGGASRRHRVSLRQAFHTETRSNGEGNPNPGSDSPLLRSPCEDDSARAAAAGGGQDLGDVERLGETGVGAQALGEIQPVAARRRRRAPRCAPSAVSSRPAARRSAAGGCDAGPRSRSCRACRDRA